MPYLQLDLNGHYPVATKQKLAGKLSATYARMMSVDIRRISVAFRELRDGSVWRVVERGDDPANWLEPLLAAVAAQDAGRRGRA